MKIPSAFVWLGGAALTETLIIFSFSSVFSSAKGREINKPCFYAAIR
ncbi:MAG: hypothetical protein ACI819_001720 [Neolewinella sp.]|jgi:hypothetical protein